MLELSGEPVEKGETMRMQDTTRGKRTFYMPVLFGAMLAMLTLLVLAPAAQAQNFFNPQGECPEELIERGDFCVAPEAAQALEADPFTCEGIPTTEEFVACLDAQSAPIAEPVPQPGELAPPTQATLAELPESGGPHLLLPLAATLMVAAGMGLAFVQRRQ